MSTPAFGANLETCPKDLTNKTPQTERAITLHTSFRKEKTVWNWFPVFVSTLRQLLTSLPWEHSVKLFH